MLPCFRRRPSEPKITATMSTEDASTDLNERQANVFNQTSNGLETFQDRFRRAAEEPISKERSLKEFSQIDFRVALCNPSFGTTKPFLYHQNAASHHILNTPNAAEHLGLDTLTFVLNQTWSCH